MYRHPFIAFFVSISIFVQGQEALITSAKCNSNYNEISAVPYKNGIVFISDRPSRFGISWVDAAGNYPSKIYYNEGKSSTIFSENLVTKFNEGPACFNTAGTTIYYTGTVKHGNGKNQNAIGIYESHFSSSGWSEPLPFEHNAPDSSYNVAHPSLNEEENLLFFTSDMEGGFGGKDIYVCKKNGNNWGLPQNLGEDINSSSDELFPFIANDHKLYFSSNREGSFDIYKAYNKLEKWQNAEKLAPPINSEFDDFAFSISSDNESGYFSSDRNSKNDDIFHFQLKYPEFENCPQAELPSFCYLFEETNIIPNDSTPMIFEWELGNGTTASGLSTEYCYTEYGTYHVALNVYDSNTKKRFARVSEVDIQIDKSPYPYIHSLDSVPTNNLIEFSAEGTDMGEAQIEEYFWLFGDGTRGKGFKVPHSYSQPGIYTVQIGTIVRTIEGETQKRCATKNIAVGSMEELAAANATSADYMQHSNLQSDMIVVNKDTTQYLMHQPDSTVYFIEFKQSEKQLQPDDPFFNNIKFEITERFDTADTAYRYSVGHTTEMPVMMRIYRDMVDNGYIESIVREDLQRQFKQEVVQTWWYMPDSMQQAINAHLNKFNDIRFDHGTYEIRPESFDNLNYIAEVMNLQQSLRLLIKAHTDSIGNFSANMALAEKRGNSVVKYLIEQGVHKTRLKSQGFGEAKPLADNSSAEGRALNRRVEFEIIFEDSKHKK